MSVVGFPEHFDPAPPRALSEVIGRKNSFWQERIVVYRFQPSLALRRRPVQQSLCRGFVSQRCAWSIVEDLQMPRIAQIDMLEVPRAVDDFRVGFPGTGAGVQQDERFHVDLATDENLPFLFQRIRRDPDTVLKISEAPFAQVASQLRATCVLGRGDIE